MAGILSLLGNRAPTGAVALKCDLFSGIASNINASIGAMSQLGSDLFNFWNVGRTNNTNREIAERNNQLAIQLAKDNNLFQERMLGKNQEWQSSEAEKAYQRELEKMRMEMWYNNPIQQVARLRAAGLNPSLAFGGSNTSSVVGASAPMASPTGSGVTPSMPVLTSPRMEAFQMASPAAAMRDIGEAIAAMSAARKAGAETDQIEQSLSDYLRKIKADADFSEVGAVLEREFGRGDRSRSQKMADQKIAEITQNIANLAKQGNYTEALTAISDVERLIKENDLEKSNLELEAFPDILHATISSMQAAAERDRSQSSLNTKLGKTEDDLRDLRGKLLSKQADQQDAAARELSALATKFNAENGMLPNQMHWQEIQRMYLQQIREDLKSKEFENTWTGRFLRSLAGPAATVGGAALGAGARILVAP